MEKIDKKEILLSDREFRLFSKLIYDKAGINIQPHKKALVVNRLRKRLEQDNFKSFKEYYDFIVKDKTETEIVSLIDAVSTNVTHFFRENKHFEFVASTVIPEIISRKNAERDKQIRVWCAASSSGEEPYSIAITFKESLNNIDSYDFKILGTDISTKVLGMANKGVYEEKKIDSVPKLLRMKYFEKSLVNGENYFKVKESVKKYIIFRRLNLMATEYPFKNPIDIIFCRNVLIYFDKPTQAKVINKFYKHLTVGGYLLLGHSEGLTGVPHNFKYIGPSIYIKEKE